MAKLSWTDSPIYSLLPALALCLAVGFWIQGRLLVPSAKWVSAQKPASGSSPVEAAAADEQAASATQGQDVRTADILSAMTPVGVIAFCWTLALQACVTYLILSRLHVAQSERQSKSHEESLHRTRDLVRTRDAVIFGLATLAESRDTDTGRHLERISLYSTRLAAALRRHPRYRDRVSSQFVRMIGVSSALHDIGKVGVEDSILLKPGSLAMDERSRMQSHTRIGAECIHNIERRLGNSNFLQMAHQIALCHHERWDGSGYPAGLSGEEIPLAARIVAIADVYDALSSRRVYKAPYPHEKCVEVIREGAGKQFDPLLVSAFTKIEDEFYEIAKRYPETMETERPGTAASDREPEHVLTPDQEHLLVSTISPSGTSLLRPQPVSQTR